MQIDPGQPIMFDSSSPPGRGTGYWQMDPGRSDDDFSSDVASQQSRVRAFVIFSFVFGVIGIAAIDMLLR